MRRYSVSSAEPAANQGTRNDWATLKTLFPYLWAYKWRMLLALVFLVGAKLANVGVPLVLKRLIDHLTLGPANPQAVLVLPVGILLAYGALRLSRKLSPRTAEVTVVDPQPHMTYQPFLPEAAAGSISPRHSVVPLRRELQRCYVLAGEVTRIEHARKVATVQPLVGPARQIPYDHIVVAPGSVSRTLPIPGLRENAIGRAPPSVMR